MTTAATTVATAPRAIDGLIELGRFGLRTLAVELGMFEDATFKMSFQSMSAQEQATAILAKLHEVDGTKAPGKAAGKAAKATGTPARTPVTTTAAKGADANGKVKSEAAADTSGNASKVLEMLGEIKDSYDSLLGEIQAMRGELQTTQYNVSGTNLLVTLGISLALQMSENVLSAPAKDVLAAALDQMNDITPQLQELVTTTLGDAPDADEGNEK